MELPFFLPENLAYCRVCETEEQLFLILSRRLDDFTLFFEHACADETWCEAHTKLLKLMLRWASKSFFLTQFPLYHAKTIVKVIKEHYGMLQPFLFFRPALFYTITFEIEGQLVVANSLAFAIASPFFLERIKHACFERLRDYYVLPNVTFVLFKLVEQYVYTGEIPNLWRNSNAEIYTLMRIAKSWEIHGLVKMCAEVLRRYLNQDNAIDSLLQAHQEGFFDWKKECCNYYNMLNKGIRFVIDHDPGLIVEILDYSDETLATFNRMSKWITHLTFQKEMSTKSEFGELLSHCPRLIGVDLSESSFYAGQFEKIPVNITELGLGHCEWLSGDYLVIASQRFKAIRKLDLSGNLQLNYQAWGNLSHFQDLKILILQHSSQITDSDLSLIAKSSSGLFELNLGNCKSINDQGIIDLFHTCTKINHLDLSNCRSIGDKAIFEIAEKAFELKRLNLENCSNVTEKALMSLVMLRSLLRYLNIRGCQVSLEAIEKMRHSRPYLQLIC